MKLHSSTHNTEVNVNSTMIIPCHGSVHCMNFMLFKYGLKLHQVAGNVIGVHQRYSSFDHVSVIAGHFSWGVWNELPGLSDPLSRNHDTPPCLVVGRHPVSRFISYYYQRCFNTPSCSGYRTPLNDMPVDLLKAYISTTRQVVTTDDEWRTQSGLDEKHLRRLYVMLDDGVSDAACRAMLPRTFVEDGDKLRVRSGRGMVLDKYGIFDEDSVAHSVSESEAPSISYDAPPPLTYDQMDGALNNVEKCVVALVEEWESSKDIGMYMQDYFLCFCILFIYLH